MLTVAFMLLGLVMLGLALADRPVRRLPLSPALIYLGVGWVAGAVFGTPSLAALSSRAPGLVVASEAIVMVSLFAVGLRLRVPPTLAAWRVALLLAGPGMVLTIAMTTLVAVAVLQMPWFAALLLASVLAPTDPVLASDVQIRSAEDGDAVRLSITAEGGLNDGTALPAVMLALGLLGLHALGPAGARWWWADLIWPMAGGAVIGTALGGLVGLALRRRLAGGDAVARDELLYVGIVAIAYALAHALQASTFTVVFAAGVTLLLPLRHEAVAGGGHVLAERMHAFGARCERLIEAATVLAIGVALHGVTITPARVGFALLLVLIVRPLSVLAVVRESAMPRNQRRLVAWFGIRGIGSVFYLLLALAQGVTGNLAADLVAATLVSIALSIALHGISATPLMRSYHRRRGG